MLSLNPGVPDIFLMAPVVPHERGLVGWSVQVYLLQQDSWPIRCASAVGIFNVALARRLFMLKTDR